MKNPKQLARLIKRRCALCGGPEHFYYPVVPTLQLPFPPSVASKYYLHESHATTLFVVCRNMPSQRQTVAREEALQGTNILLLKEQAKKYAFIGNEANSISF